MQDYQTRVQNYIQQNYPNATVGDVLGKKEIVKQEFPYLLGTLPYRTAVKGTTFAVIPDSYRHKLSFSVTNEAATLDLSAYDPDAPAPVDSSLRITRSLPELAGKKITLSYSPATPQDEAVINSYLPSPHADGTPIQPSELPSQLPAYLINVKPELRIDWQVVATGETIGLGGTNIFTMTFADPSYGTDQITNYIDAGVYQAIGLNLGRISKNQLTALKAKLEATKTKLQNNDFSDMTKDDLVGDLLYTTAMVYHAEFDTMNFITARTMGVNAVTLPSETSFSTKLKVMLFWGIPRYVQPGGLEMDADRLANVVNAKDGNADTARNYMLSSGMTSSALEHSVPEQLFSTPDNQSQGISAVKALKIANDQNIPIYTVNQSNIATVMPQLQVDQQVKDDITHAVNAGKVVTVSKTNINFNGWNGCGYIIVDPTSGAGAYKISGGANGAYIFWTVMWVLAWTTLIVAATVFVVLLGAILAPIIASVLAAIAPIIDAILVGSANLYLAAGVRVASYPILSALLSSLYTWNDWSPQTSLWPVPTDPVNIAIFVGMFFRFFLVNELIPMLRTKVGYLIIKINNNYSKLRRYCVSQYIS